MADLRPLPGLSADWGPSSAERSAGLSCRLCVAGCQVLRRRATQSPGPACTPGGAHSSGRVEGPAGYAARGGGPPQSAHTRLGAGAAVWGGVRVGLGKRVPWGPRTVGKEPKVFSPASVPPPTILDRDPVSFGVRPSLCRREGGRGVRPAPQGWRPGSRSSKDSRTPTRRLGVPGCVCRFLGLSTRGRLSPHQDSGTRAHPAAPCQLA